MAGRSFTYASRFRIPLQQLRRLLPPRADKSACRSNKVSERSEVMSKMKNFLIALAWCWASAFISLLIMADNGTFAVEDLPVYAFMATIALFVGPLFFAAGLFGHGGSPIVFPVALISYVVYIVLLWKAVCSKNPWTRYACLSIITICAFIGWQGVRNSI